MKQSIIRITTGLLVVAIGTGALLDTTIHFPFWGWFSNWWPALIAVVGAFLLISDLRRNYVWGLVLIVSSALLLARNITGVEFNVVGLIFPMLIIAAGLSVIASSQRRASIPTNTKDTDDIAVFFGGSETLNKSKNYKGGRATVVFGGATLDLRDTKLDGEAVLDAFIVCGGLELRVPREWRVVVKSSPIAAGIENKSQGNEGPKAPILILSGTVVLGGIEIKT